VDTPSHGAAAEIDDNQISIEPPTWMIIPGAALMRWDGLGDRMSAERPPCFFLVNSWR
jgi:hypothetical protein